MKKSDVVFVEEFSSNAEVNDLLAKGWLLLHVGPNVHSVENGQLYYDVIYVLGATSELRDAYLQQLDEDIDEKEFLS
jgi:hypothetical protein